jgi:dinuclear metal center YbgI/SA1388 family protein
MDLSELCTRLDDLLDVDAYADHDPNANGLQVGPDDATVEHAAFAVDAAVESVERAIDAGADMLVTHHGVGFGGFERVTGRQFDRIAPLVENDVALYSAHLPLDGHQELGNAAGVADLLGLDDREPFGALGEQFVGTRGRFAEPQSADDIAARLAAELDTADQPTQLLDFGPDEVRDVAILTGSGADWVDEAAAVGADVLITGEGKQALYHQAKESGVTVILGGHYATETFGVRNLQALAEDWGLETTFVDAPTGL